MLLHGHELNGIVSQVANAWQHVPRKLQVGVHLHAQRHPFTLLPLCSGHASARQLKCPVMRMLVACCHSKMGCLLPACPEGGQHSAFGTYADKLPYNADLFWDASMPMHNFQFYALTKGHGQGSTRMHSPLNNIRYSIWGSEKALWVGLRPRALPFSTRQRGELTQVLGSSPWAPRRTCPHGPHRCAGSPGAWAAGT